MNIKVKEDYYSEVCTYYASQIEAIEGYLDEFKEQYQTLFEKVDFGEHLGMVLVGKSDGFYSATRGQLIDIFVNIQLLTSDFTTEIAEDDILS